MDSGPREGPLRRLWLRLRGGDAHRLDPDRPDLVVIASGFDDAEACSTSLARATHWLPDRPVVLRHVLVLPAEEIDTAESTVAQDGYRRSPAPPDVPDVPGSVPMPPDLEPVIFERVQILDALHCSQERSRMAGLAQRRGGSVVGWLALQPAVARPR